MNDTPKHIRQLQLEIWLSKTPAERLRQFMEDNDALFNLWKEQQAKLNEVKDYSNEPEASDTKAQSNIHKTDTNSTS